METVQQYLFNVDLYNVNFKLKAFILNLKIYGCDSFSIDKIQKIAIVYGVSCDTILKIYENIKHEQLSNNTNDQKHKGTS